jgi:capsular polysaccharide biosynthesis protein
MLLYTVPAAVYFVQNRPTYRKFFVRINHPNMLALLHLIGLTDEEIINHDYHNKSYHFDELYLFRKEFRDMFVGPTEHAAYDYVRARAEERSRWPAAAKVFISRLQLTREGGKRGLINELELSERLATLGFSAVEPDRLAVEDQIAAFGAARQIVGLGGAGLFGTVFCRPNATLLDIESSTTFLDAHTNLFASCGLNVGVVLGAGDPSDPRGDHRR